MLASWRWEIGRIWRVSGSLGVIPGRVRGGSRSVRLTMPACLRGIGAMMMFAPSSVPFRPHHCDRGPPDSLKFPASRSTAHWNFKVGPVPMVPVGVLQASRHPVESGNRSEAQGVVYFHGEISHGAILSGPWPGGYLFVFRPFLTSSASTHHQQSYYRSRQSG